MFHVTTTTGEKTFQMSDKSSNGRVQHVRISLPVLNLENEEPWVPAAPANDYLFPERLYQECLNRVSSVTGFSILHERDIRNLTSLN
ncbi:hypothetical protein TNCV_3108081 [Trichonephila clavipes]|uniref:Uncharacterized protein n=1 Tax=Trichonephila clavipes TaxID=2585209 RepID=A0A8X6VG54_TRICX|nr:hypothetical protein TNCV_3108081 [Trichonephila clavipes]